MRRRPAPRRPPSPSVERRRRPDREPASRPRAASRTSAAPAGCGRDPELVRLAHVDAFRREPAAVWAFYAARFAGAAAARPNAGHGALAALQAAGRLDAPRDAEHRRPAPCRRLRPDRGARLAGAWPAAPRCGRELPMAEALRAPRGGRRRRAALRLRRRPPARRRHVRRAAAGGRHRRGLRGRRVVRPPARRRQLARGAAGRRAAGGREGERRRASRSSTAIRRPTTASPTSSTAGRWARACPRWPTPCSDR